MAIGIVGIEGDSHLTFGYGLIVLPFQRIELAQARMGHRQGIIQSEGLSLQLESPLWGLGVSTPVIDPLPVIGPPQLRVCLRTLRVQGHSFLPQHPCLGNSLLYVDDMVEESELVERQTGAPLGARSRLAARVAASPIALSPNGCKGKKSRIARRGKPR